jgi:hypothetical protein
VVPERVGVAQEALDLRHRRARMQACERTTLTLAALPDTCRRTVAPSPLGSVMSEPLAAERDGGDLVFVSYTIYRVLVYPYLLDGRGPSGPPQSSCRHRCRSAP